MPQDVRAALRGRSLRRELARIRRLGWLITIAVLLLLLTIVLWQGMGRISAGRAMMIAALMVIGAYPWLMYRWLVHRHIKANAGLIGPIKGWIDRQSLWIEDPHQIRVRWLSQLVGAARSGDQIVLCFDPTQTVFETLPLRGFDDPDTARVLAEEAARARPLGRVLTLDSRRLVVPSEPPCFPSGANACCFAGRLLTDDLRGTPLVRAQWMAKLRVLGMVLITLTIATLLIIALSPPAWLTMVVLASLVLALARLAVRVVVAPLVGQADRQVMFESAGWLDSEHVVSMTSIGQTQSKWSAFDAAAITSRVICLKSRGSRLWYLVGRGQFAQSGHWEAACQLVRRHARDVLGADG